jgi:hypothetical protein
MLTRISDFFKNNSAKILSTVGVLTVIGLVVAGIYQGINYISSLRGFNFDPFLLIGIIIFVLYFNGILQNQNLILSKQQALLEKLLDTKSNTSSSRIYSPKPKILKKVVATRAKK